MADAAQVRRRGTKNPTDLSTSEDYNYKTKPYCILQASHGYSWIFAVTVCFYGVISIVAFLESRSVPPPKPHDTHFGEFSEDRARVHLDAITSYGPRPTGSIANEIHAVNYILKQVNRIKATAKKSIVIEVDIQRPTGTFALDFLDGFTSHYYNITNIVVRVSPATNFPAEHTVLINAHFDSVPGALGASDDAVSCATMLEILRVISQCPKVKLTNGLIFLFNGAEENILQASHGFITQHPWAKSIRAFINLEAAGAGGKEIVFQSGPEHPWLVRAYTEVAPFPSAQVIGQEIFHFIPSDTDFRIFRDYGHIPGIDIAYHTNGYVYHTYYDTPEAITKGSIQRAGENVFSVTMEMANSPLLQDPGEYRHGAMVFFDFMGLFMVHYPERIGVIINGITFIVTTLLILKKFFPGKKKGETHQEVAKSTIKCFVISLGILLVAWIAGLVLPLIVAAVLTKAGHSMTWFCRPYLLVGLFVAPAILGLGAVHCLAKNYTLKKKAKSKDPKNILSTLWKQENDIFYASLFIWNGLLGIMTYYNLASAHIPLLFVLFPLIIRVIVWEKIIQRNNCVTKNVGQFLVCYLAAMLVPLCFTAYAKLTILELFVPIAGRSGSDIIPDLFIAGIVGGVAIIQTSYLISLTYIIRDVKWPTILLVGLTALSMAVSLSGLSFPFSKELQCPKRLFFQHCVRTFHGPDGNVLKQDSGIWLHPLDYTGIAPLHDVPLMKEAREVVTNDGVYGGFPFYLPARRLFSKSFYIPGPPPDVNALLWDFKLLSRSQKGNILEFTFSITGPDHMSIYFETAKNVVFVSSSIGNLEPTSGNTYFVYYSHGTRTEPWYFSLKLQVDNNLRKNSPVMDFAIAAHYLDGKQSKTPFLNKLIEQCPDWVFAHSWVNIYESWTYTI